MEKIIRIENLTFEYPPEEEGADAVKALNGIGFEIEKGSFTAVLGRNGSGKSTLSKQLNALLIPKEGDVIVCGINTRQEERVWEIRSSAGMVFQNPDNQLISAVVEDDVAFGPENLGIPAEEIRRRIDDAMKRVGIYELRKKSPHMLSGGQKQRVAIAGVVAMRPQCIIFDEPTAMLDPKGRREVMEIVRSLRQDGITVILITHFMEEAVEASWMAEKSLWTDLLRRFLKMSRDFVNWVWNFRRRWISVSICAGKDSPYRRKCSPSAGWRLICAVCPRKVLQLGRRNRIFCPAASRPIVRRCRVKQTLC